MDDSKLQHIILSYSGAKRQGQAETGGPEVMMWCVTLCLIGESGEHTCVRVGNCKRRVR